MRGGKERAIELLNGVKLYFDTWINVKVQRERIRERRRNTNGVPKNIWLHCNHAEYGSNPSTIFGQRYKNDHWPYA